jgi:3-oxoacyl-[acyl-carrier protein] reductase
MRTPVILVTGAGRGLGRGIALELAKEGFSVAINYVANKASADETAALCRESAKAAGQFFCAIQADVGVKADRERLLKETLSMFGRIDGLVNNAGIAPRVRRDLLQADEASFEELMRVNLQGPYFLTQAVANHWLGRNPKPALKSGHKVVFVTSISSNTASVNRGDYCVSKAGLSMASQLWAVRLAPHGIQVVEVRPGIMATDMTAGAKAKYDKLLAEGLVPQGRWGTPEDVGLAVRSIMAGNLPFSSGAVIQVDGGFQLRRL